MDGLENLLTVANPEHTAKKSAAKKRKQSQLTSARTAGANEAAPESQDPPNPPEAPRTKAPAPAPASSASAFTRVREGNVLGSFNISQGRGRNL